ncbi:hypothetical protein [Conexibacter woesei]|uniref:hypothetical protein n=1 Tax=Conexibacter woesei TaxID=191495 RepID=UPI0004243D54|nr:hypothetical protein [Conexibacter woesei]
MSASTPRAKNLALVLLAMTQFVIVIDASIVNVALPSIGAHLHFSRDELTKGFDRAFLVGAGFAVAGAILAAVLISSSDSHEHSQAARLGEAAGVDAAAVPVAAR